MKVTVHLKSAVPQAGEASARKAAGEDAVAFAMAACPSDSVRALKDKIAAAQLVPFRERDLVLAGKVLPEHLSLEACGVTPGSALDFVVRGSAADLAQQLAGLLCARELSVDELGLLYCYKHGASFGQAARSVGISAPLQTFLQARAEFAVRGSHVTLGPKAAVASGNATVDVALEVQRLLSVAGPAGLETSTLSQMFVRQFGVSLESLTGAQRPAEFLSRAGFAVSTRGLVAIRKEAPMSAATRPPPGLDAENDADCRAPSSVRASDNAVPSCNAKTENKEKTKAEEPALQTEDNDLEAAQYLELHNRVSGRSFNSKVAQALADVIDSVSERLFLCIDHVARGGSVGKGTAVMDVTDAELVFFLRDVPPTADWVPSLLRSVAGGLREHMHAEIGFTNIRATSESVTLLAHGLVNVSLRFCPAFPSHAAALHALAALHPDARRTLSAAYVKERSQFVAKQPGQVKVTMRLLKWWRNQQAWSSEVARPSDELLELLAIYSAVRSRPMDQREAIANIMSLMSRLDELRIVWSNFYAQEDVWTPLLHHRPLVMDPADPFVNVADPQIFDPNELMELARTTHFFW